MKVEEAEKPCRLMQEKYVPCLQLDRGRQRSLSQLRHLLGGVGAVFGKLKRHLESKDVFQCLQMFVLVFSCNATVPSLEYLALL